MTMLRTRSLLFVNWLLLIVPFAAHAQTGGSVIQAASCQRADVNAVINGPTHTAVNGDTIVIPAGTCTWTSGITVSGVGIDITGTGTPNTGGGTVGAGTSNTTLITNGAGTFFSFTRLTTSSATAKVELLTLSGNGSTNSGMSFLGTCTTSPPYCPSIRVDNINFASGTWLNSQGGYVIVDNVFGVVDHNSVSEVITSGGGPPLVEVNYDAWQGVGSWGDNSFATADTFGTAQAIYLENNSLDGIRGTDNDIAASGSVDGGARYVCRFNNYPNMNGTGMCSAHGTAWSGRMRGMRQMEVYYNAATIGVKGCNALNGINSGTGYYLSNAVTASACNEYLAVSYNRLTGSTAPWMACDGTQPWDYSPWSTSTPCLDQAGSGVGLLYTSGNPPRMASAPGTPCTTAGQCWPNPALDPVYEAGELSISGNAPSPVSIANDGTQLRILFNRDVYGEISEVANSGCPGSCTPFTGATGTGYGTLSQRPSSCTPRVGYWATDQGSWNTYNSQKGVLYVCTSTNTWTAYYTPYTYPHPLTTGGTSVGVNPNPPTGLTVTVQAQ